MAGKRKRFVRVFLPGMVFALGAIEPAAALPADASCVYLAIGCYAPSPLPQPKFPDPLFPPIPVPSVDVLVPAAVVPVVVAPAPPEVARDVEPTAHRHGRKSRQRHERRR